MNNELEILDSMLNKNKISITEYDLLSEAITNKLTNRQSIFYFLINPFQKIAGLWALVIGLTILLLMSVIGVIAKVYFAGLFGCIVAANFLNSNIKPNFILLLYQNFAACFLLSILFFCVSTFFRQKRIRIIDFFGTVFLSRFPLLVLTSIVALITLIDVNAMNYDVAQDGHFRPTIMSTVIHAAYFLCTVWQAVTYFFALKESSGLVGNRLWISFILLITLGDLAADQLALIFLM